jgi:prophage tail gpP-like protein
MPPAFTNDAEGGLDTDVVTLTIGGRELSNFESYEITSSILEVPNSFAARLGHSGIVRELIALCPPNAPYELRISGQLQASGNLDGYSVPSDAGATLELKGRDILAPLHDAYIREEESFANKSYLDIVQVALAQAGVRPGGVVLHDNAANRRSMSGAEAKARTPRNVEEIVLEKGTGGVVQKTVVARMSETWLGFLRTHLDRAGLFLWPTASGDWCLARPNPFQEPLYALTLDPARQEDDRGFRGGVRRDTYRNGVEPPRYSEVIVYSRTSSKKYGRTKVKSGFVDEEMLALGIDRPLTLKDADVATPEQAERLAQRKLAEGRRATFSLSYTTHGHTARAVSGAGRAVWTPDTVVALDDREAGLSGNFYVDAVTFRRSAGGTSTTLKLSRPADILFGDEPDEAEMARALVTGASVVPGKLVIGEVEIVAGEVDAPETVIFSNER